MVFPFFSLLKTSGFVFSERGAGPFAMSGCIICLCLWNEFEQKRMVDGHFGIHLAVDTPFLCSLQITQERNGRVEV